MPRLAKTPRDEFMTNIAANIKYHQTMIGAKSKVLSQVSGKALSTYNERMQNPEHFTIGEIYNLAKFMRVPVKDLIVGRHDESTHI